MKTRIKWGVHHDKDEMRDREELSRIAALTKLRMDGLGHCVDQLETVIHEDGSRTMFIRRR